MKIISQEKLAESLFESVKEVMKQTMIQLVNEFFDKKKFSNLSANEKQAYLDAATLIKK